MDVLHVDDRVVHDLADRDREPAERQRVERGPQGVQDHDRREERERDRRERDRGRAEVPKEEEQNDADEEPAEQKRVGDVSDRLLDEGRGAKEGRVEVDPLALEEALHLVESALDPSRDLQRVRPVLAGDDEDDAALALDGRVPDRRLGAVLDSRHVADADARSGTRPDEHVTKRRERCRLALRAKDDALAPRLDEARSAHARRTPRGLDHLVDAHAEERETIGEDLHLDLPHVAAEDGDLRHAAHAQQAGLERPIGERPKIHRGPRVRGEPQREDHARARREGRDGRRRDSLRHPRGRLGEPLRDDLPGAEDVGAVAKRRGHDRQPLDRLRAQRFEAARASDGPLDGPRDEGLDLLGREARRFGLDDDLRGRELGVHVELRLRERNHPVGERGDGEAQDDARVPDRELDEALDHLVREEGAAAR